MSSTYTSLRINQLDEQLQQDNNTILQAYMNCHTDIVKCLLNSPSVAENAAEEDKKDEKEVKDKINDEIDAELAQSIENGLVSAAKYFDSKINYSDGLKVLAKNLANSSDFQKKIKANQFVINDLAKLLLDLAPETYISQVLAPTFQKTKLFLELIDTITFLIEEGVLSKPGDFKKYYEVQSWNTNVNNFYQRYKAAIPASVDELRELKRLGLSIKSLYELQCCDDCKPSLKGHCDFCKNNNNQSKFLSREAIKALLTGSDLELVKKLEFIENHRELSVFEKTVENDVFDWDSSYSVHDEVQFFKKHIKDFNKDFNMVEFLKSFSERDRCAFSLEVPSKIMYFLKHSKIEPQTFTLDILKKVIEKYDYIDHLDDLAAYLQGDRKKHSNPVDELNYLLSLDIDKIRALNYGLTFSEVENNFSIMHFSQAFTYKLNYSAIRDLQQTDIAEFIQNSDKLAGMQAGLVKEVASGSFNADVFKLAKREKLDYHALADLTDDRLYLLQNNLCPKELIFENKLSREFLQYLPTGILTVKKAKELLATDNPKQALESFVKEPLLLKRSERMTSSFTLTTTQSSQKKTDEKHKKEVDSSSKTLIFSSLEPEETFKLEDYNIDTFNELNSHIRSSLESSSSSSNVTPTGTGS